VQIFSLHHSHPPLCHQLLECGVHPRLPALAGGLEGQQDIVREADGGDGFIDLAFALGAQWGWSDPRAPGVLLAQFFNVLLHLFNVQDVGLFLQVFHWPGYHGCCPLSKYRAPRQSNDVIHANRLHMAESVRLVAAGLTLFVIKYIAEMATVALTLSPTDGQLALERLDP